MHLLFKILSIALVVFFLQSCSDSVIKEHQLIAENVSQYDRATFRIEVGELYENPYDQEEVMLDMVINTPGGDEVVLPCFYDSIAGQSTIWKARYAPSEAGEYSYYYKLTKPGGTTESSTGEFTVLSSDKDGFLRLNNLWTLKFDSGKPFRGIGENVGWEARSYEDPKYTYDYLLPTLSKNGANFFRTWMCSWDLPVSWQKVGPTDRYEDSEEYFHPGGIKRMDELIDMCDSLDLYLMLAMDYHGALIPGGSWDKSRYNKANGGPAATPLEFFTSEEARKMSKNKFRYLIARWGYSTHLAAWEFFNEIDNAVFTPTPHDSTLIPHKYVTDWHREMSNYIKSIDPYQHIVTTSVSHREIDGMFQLENIDIAQRHIYKRTDEIPALINKYVKEYEKPFVWGEFGYEWDWNLDFSTIAEESDYDYKRGLWYGLFNPTPILPMTWWWEFFDERNMTPYFQSVRQINYMMLAEGNGHFEQVPVQSEGLEAYSVKCGDTYFVGVLNNDQKDQQSDLLLDISSGSFRVQQFNPDDRTFTDISRIQASAEGLKIPQVSMTGMDEMVYVLTLIDEI